MVIKYSKCARIEQIFLQTRVTDATGERVRALKLVIQAAKSLSDTGPGMFYPVHFSKVAELLDTFGQLLYTRLLEISAQLGEPLGRGGGRHVLFLSCIIISSIQLYCQTLSPLILQRNFQPNKYTLRQRKPAGTGFIKSLQSESSFQDCWGGGGYGAIHVFLVSL